MAHVKITWSKNPKDTTIEVDGHTITNVTGVQIDIEARGAPKVVIETLAFPNLELDLDDSDVTIIRHDPVLVKPGERWDPSKGHVRCGLKAFTTPDESPERTMMETFCEREIPFIGSGRELADEARGEKVNCSDCLGIMKRDGD